MANKKNKKNKKAAKKVTFNGFVVDMFVCDDGRLGMTVEREDTLHMGDSAPYRDVYITRELDVQAI